MASKTIKEIPLGQLKRVEEFTSSQIQAARTTIRLHLDHADYQNTITQNEIEIYSKLLDRKKSVICELVEEEEGEIVTIEQRANIERRELVEA